MIKKKAQAEDIFADFVIALIFIIVAVILISFTESSTEEKLPFKVRKEAAGLYTIDILSMLKSDLRSYGYREMTFAELFAIIAEGDEEKYFWIFGEGALAYEKRGRKQCTEELEMMIAEKFAFGWDIQLYSESGSELFRCTPRGREPVYDRAAFCRQTSLWIPLHEKGSARLEAAVCP